MRNHDKQNVEQVLDNQIFKSDFLSFHAVFANEIGHLISILPSDITNAGTVINDVKTRIKQINNEESPQKLSYAYEYMKKNEILNDNFFCAFLCVNLAPQHRHYKKFILYKALIFFVSLELYRMGRHESATIAVCNEIRQWGLEKRPELGFELPEIIENTIEKIVDELDAKYVDLSNTKNNKISNQIYRIFIPIRDFLEEKTGIVRGVSSADLKHSPPTKLNKPDAEKFISKFNITKSEIDYEDAYIYEISDYDTTHDQTDPDLELASNKILQVRIETASSNGYEVGSLRLKAIKNQYVKNSKHLSCNIHQASEHELKVLINELFKLGDDKSFIRSWVLTSLILGQSIKNLKTQLFDVATNTMKREHVLPSQNQPEYLKPYIKDVATSFQIHIPLEINVGHLIVLDDKSENKIQEWLKKFNKSNNCHLTERKTFTFFGQFAKQNGINPAISALIQAKPLDTTPELFYTQMHVSDINKTVQCYLRYLSGISGNNFNLQKSNEHDDIIGTPLKVEPQIIKNLLDNLHDRIKIKRHHFDENRHNDVCYHAQIILAISSGYRNVTGRFGKLSHIDLEHKRFWISDKEISKITNGRIITLPDLCNDILNNYIKYLKEAANVFRHSNPTVSERYLKSLDSREHLFFYRRNNEIEEITPTTMKNHFEDIFPLPLNWNRHYVRSHLTEKNIDPEIIGAWMGHAEENQPAFTKFSSMSVRDLNVISNCINELFISLGLKAFNYA
jgi:hypothetical protein